MPTAKARYLGDGDGAKTKEFSLGLKSKLRNYFSGEQLDACEIWGHQSDIFVSQVLAEAQWAVAELYWQKLDTTKQEIRAEYRDLLKQLKSTCAKLCNLSPDFARLLDPDADPIGCADMLRSFCCHIEQAGGWIDNLPDRKKPAEKNHFVAVELATRVLRVLKQNKIAPAATCDIDLGHMSDAVRILKMIGDDIGLYLSEVTWRDIILEAKQGDTDLK